MAHPLSVLSKKAAPTILPKLDGLTLAELVLFYNNLNKISSVYLLLLMPFDGINLRFGFEGLCAKLPINRQSETSLGKGEKGEKILTLHVEGFQNLQKHVEGFWNLLTKQLELINKESPSNFINLK